MVVGLFIFAAVGGLAWVNSESLLPIDVTPKRLSLGNCDRRTLNYDNNRSITFTLHNRSPESIVLKGVNGGCGCITTTNETFKIAPNSAGKVNMMLDLSRQKGDFSHEISFFVEYLGELHVLSSVVSGSIPGTQELTVSKNERNSPAGE